MRPGATGGTGKTLAGGPTPRPPRAGRPRLCGLGLLLGRRWGLGRGRRGRRRARAAACLSAGAGAGSCVSDSLLPPAPAPPARPPAGPPGLPPPPPPAPPAAWQAAGCTGGGSRRSHDLSGCLSSSGSYSFPARKQPGLLSKPPWPQGRRGRPGVAALARSLPGRRPRRPPRNPRAAPAGARRGLLVRPSGCT